MKQETTIPLAGAATPEGTARYAARAAERGFGPHAYRLLGRSRLSVFALGFGGYRVDAVIPEHGAALERALRLGCNLIDTSTNYSDGSSEVLVGRVLRRLVGEGAVARDEVVVVTKIGYVQGSNLEIAEARENDGNPIPDMVKYADGCWHCIHPEFIADQIDRSLKRLGLAKIDVLLLHNPEYFLSDLKKRMTRLTIVERRERFYDRLRSAFAYLDEEVERGRIGCYGVSSNTLGAPTEAAETTSLSRLWESAADLAKRKRGSPELHFFSVAQLPLNLFESGPAIEHNTGTRAEVTALEFAQEKDIGLLVNRPLNAYVRNQLVRLAEPETLKVAVSQEAQAGKVADLEAEFVRDVAPSLDTGDGEVAAKDFFRWGVELGNHELSQIGFEAWMPIESDMVRPQVSYLIGQLDAHLAESALAPTWQSWRDRYLEELETLLAVIRSSAASASRGTALALTQRLDPLLPESWRTARLSQKSLAVLVHTPGVTSVLNGMRRRSYVDDSLGALKLTPAEIGPDLYASFQLPV